MCTSINKQQCGQWERIAINKFPLNAARICEYNVCELNPIIARRKTRKAARSTRWMRYARLQWECMCKRRQINFRPAQIQREFNATRHCRIICCDTEPRYRCGSTRVYQFVVHARIHLYARTCVCV